MKGKGVGGGESDRIYAYLPSLMSILHSLGSLGCREMTRRAFPEAFPWRLLMPHRIGGQQSQIASTRGNKLRVFSC